jgi:hypothetical protein
MFLWILQEGSLLKDSDKWTNHDQLTVINYTKPDATNYNYRKQTKQINDFITN